MAEWRILTGDVRDVLSTLPANSVQTVITSPPYWGLRDYGVDGQIGLERTPDEYVAALVEVFAEVWRVLADDGTLWLNLGDCYATGAGKVGECPGGGEQGARWRGEVTRHRDEKRRDDSKGRGTPSRADGSGGHRYVGPMTQPNRIEGLKPKDLVGIPWRVAFALQAAGWYLRSDIIWSKPNPMPESVQDRPTKAHEYIFLLTKRERYYYDSAAIREPYSDRTLTQFEKPYTGEATKDYDAAGVQNPSDIKRRIVDKQRGHGRRRAGFNDRWDAMPKDAQQANGANKRSVWHVATHPYPEAHFATFPEDLIEPCILAGSRPSEVVLDPFCGSGTTGAVAVRHQRNFIGVELNPSYVELARRRIGAVAPLFASEVSA